MNEMDFLCMYREDANYIFSSHKLNHILNMVIMKRNKCNLSDNNNRWLLTVLSLYLDKVNYLTTIISGNLQYYPPN
jgi:hypothetical protein